jgi:tetratricopeptide (TPR) repeat protein
MSALLKQAQTALNAGNAAAALQATQAAVKANPNDANAHYLQACALRMAGRAGDALRILDFLNQRLPNQPDLINMAGLCRRDMGDVSGARRDFEQVIRLVPGHIPALGNLAGLLSDAEPEAALGIYEKLGALQPQNAEPFALAASLALSLRALGRAEAFAAKAEKIAPGAVLTRSVLAGLDLARDDAAAARQRLAGHLAGRTAPPAQLAVAWGRLGEACHRLDDFPAAFDAWSNANRIQRQDWDVRFARYDGPRSLASATRLADWFEAHDPAPVKATELEGPAPVFQVGFPRSGTTLLEQMLGAHPGIETLEEQDAIGPIIQAIGDTPTSLARLKDLPITEINAIRAAYWAQARPDGPPPDDRVFIDKYPMNLVWLGPLMRIFPDAKIIFCLRDPRDCVFSAFQQRFAVNPEMYRTLEVAECAQLYDTAMRAGQAAMAASHAVPVHSVRYEDVVADYRGVMTPLFEFLGLDWDEAVETYREKAEIKRIKTPSAPQVVKPLYASSIGKWRAYEFALEPALATLKPWVERYGYDA